MIIKAIIGILIGSGIGFGVGYFAKSCGASGWVITCNPWGAMVFGGLLGLIIATGSVGKARYERDIPEIQSEQAEEPEEQGKILPDENVEKSDQSDGQNPADNDEAGQ